MSAFSVTRNMELSTLYYLETQINANWTGITIVKSFLSAYDKTLPVVCIRLLNTNSIRLELGSNTLQNTYMFTVDIFATSDGQRIDLADFVLNKLKPGWDYFTHSKVSGATTLDRVSAGRIRVDSFLDNSRIDFGDEAENPDRFRHTISFMTRKNY